MSEWKQYQMPAVALRGLVLFPKMILHFDVGREKSILALNAAMKDGKRVFLLSIIHISTPGDVVVIVQPESDTPAIIKRIIAVEGQTVDINFSFGTVTVDGQVLEEDYINEPTYMKRDVDFPVTVPQGCVFVMGDNRRCV